MSLRFRMSLMGRRIWMRSSRFPLLMRPELAEAAAKYIARAMAYDDVIRVACLKTQPSRMTRIQREMGGLIVAITEFMHPRMAELLGLLPPALGMALERRPRLVAWLDRVFCGPRRVRTDTDRRISAALHRRRLARLAPPHLAPRSGMAPDRRLAGHSAVGCADPRLAAELLANQRLIKGYSDTHARGLG